MKVFVVALLTLASYACAEYAQEVHEENTAYGYLTKIGIPEAERIRKAEEQYLRNQRIVGGLPAGLGQYPYQAGLLSSIMGISSTGVCGGILISPNRVLSAAHCWFDGVNQAWKFTVVLGSVLLFNGGTRIDSSAVAVHPNWSPLLVRNDVLVIYLPNNVALSNTISPVALPSGDELNEDFEGRSAIATGFGLTSDGGSIGSDQFLSQVRLNVISNTACSLYYPLNVHATNICTSGIGGVGTCQGDSGGPLVVTSNGRDIVIYFCILISPNRVLSAAHCWFDGVNQAWKFTVVLGSVLLFNGGTRIDSSAVAVHPNWSPLLVRNDVLVIYLPNNVALSNTISPVALPSGDELNEDFEGRSAIATGFGLTSDGGSIGSDQFLSQVRLNVISNTACSLYYPLNVHATNICTSGIGGVGTCQGDSGGPLVVTSNGRDIVIGVTSFGSSQGCQTNRAAVYARVTSFVDFINQHV